GEMETFLFVLPANGAPGPGLSVFRICRGKEDLRKEVEAFRSLLGRPGTDLSALQERGRHLYELLVHPAEPVVAKAERWLISPDGPLHGLPFAALLAGDHYLAELKPIHLVASAAAYRQIKAARPEKTSGPTMGLLAAGDPLYPSKTGSQDPQVQTAVRRGLQLEPIP